MHCIAIQETSGKTLLKMGLSHRVSVPIHVFISSTVELSWKSANYRTPLPTGSLLGSFSMGENVVREGMRRFGGNELAPSCLLCVPITMATVLNSISPHVCFEFPFPHSESCSLITSPSTIITISGEDSHELLGCPLVWDNACLARRGTP